MNNDNSKCGQMHVDEIKSLLDLIESDGNLSLEEMLDLVEHPERYLPAAQPSFEEYVKERVSLFAKNVDYAQEQLENVTKEIGDSLETTPDITVTEFMQARMDTFTRNLEKISSSFAL